jgi:hypothetical protein
MPQVPSGINDIADAGLEFFYFRKSAIPLPIPEDCALFAEVGLGLIAGLGV